MRPEWETPASSDWPRHNRARGVFRATFDAIASRYPRDFKRVDYCGNDESSRHRRIHLLNEIARSEHPPVEFLNMLTSEELESATAALAMHFLGREVAQ